MSAQPPPPGSDPAAMSEEELRAAYEEELKRIRVEDVLVQTVVSLLNLGARRAGLAGGDEEPDFEQVRQAVDATRALLPLVEPALGPDARQLRDALSQLQLAYARSGAKPPPGAPAAEQAGAEREPAAGDQPGPAQSSGRLWIPGQ